MMDIEKRSHHLAERLTYVRDVCAGKHDDVCKACARCGRDRLEDGEDAGKARRLAAVAVTSPWVAPGASTMSSARRASV